MMSSQSLMTRSSQRGTYRGTSALAVSPKTRLSPSFRWVETGATRTHGQLESTLWSRGAKIRWVSSCKLKHYGRSLGRKITRHPTFRCVPQILSLQSQAKEWVNAINASVALSSDRWVGGLNHIGRRDIRRPGRLRHAVPSIQTLVHGDTRG